MVRPKPCAHQRFTCLPCAIAAWLRREAEGLNVAAKPREAEALILRAEAIERGQPWREP